jgi:manganese oxidase
VKSEDQGSGVFVAGFFLAALALLIVPLSVIGVVSVVQDDSTAAASAPTVANISLQEFSITGNLTVPAGAIRLAVTNDGTVEHDLKLEGGPGTPMLAPGATATLDLGTLAPGTYTLICTVAGHADAGMKAELVVTATGSPGAPGDGHGGHGVGGATVDYAAHDRSMVESILKFPAATKGTGNQPLQPTVGADGTKEFALTAEIIDWEVEPGRFVKAWAYNGQVPGPALKVALGEKFRIAFRNNLPMGSDIHAHGIDLTFKMDGVAPITQNLVKPGETFVYEYTATKRAVAMYHAHAHAYKQVPNGLFGTLLIGDMPLPKGRTISGVTIPSNLQVAKEIPMVLNDAGAIGYSLNGKSFPATEPYTLKTGEWMLVHYFNEGLQVHPMHLHQFPQLVVAKDGIPLDQPYWADTVLVSPGERYSVLVHADQAGTWVWHCHMLHHVERESGMFGMVTAVVVS